MKYLHHFEAWSAELAVIHHAPRSVNRSLSNFWVSISFDTKHNYIVGRRFEPPFYRQPPLDGQTPFLSFFWNSLLTKLFQQYRPNEIPYKKNKLMWQSYSFIFRRLKNIVTCMLFYKKYFCLLHNLIHNNDNLKLILIFSKRWLHQNQYLHLIKLIKSHQN